MRLLTWNLNGRRSVGRQAAAVADREPDILALQKLTSNSVPGWRTALTDSGLTHVIDSFANAPSWQAAGLRRYGLLIGSRFPLLHLLSEHPVLWPERVLTALVTTPGARNSRPFGITFPPRELLVRVRSTQSHQTVVEPASRLCRRDRACVRQFANNEIRLPGLRDD